MPAQYFDDGSSIQTFDDGSTLSVGNDGLLSSSPSSDAVTDKGSASSWWDMSSIRKRAAGLFSGGAQTDRVVTAPRVNTLSQGQAQPLDWRVRISLSGRSWTPLMDDADSSLLSPLTRTAETGVIFPYTPAITVAHNARYQEQALTHSNYKNYFYEGSDVAAITIAGDFTVQTVDEGQYLLAAIYFFRTCTKMFFGNEQNAGNPPPIVFLDGYGDYYFPHVSCVVTNFTHTMPDSVDYLEIPVGSSATVFPGTKPAANKLVRLPTASQISVTVQPVYSRANVYKNFTLGKFAQGKLLSGNGGFL
jgi:hypothetical protein